MEEYLHKEITSDIIQAFYKVYNTLGFGFLEKVYRNSMSIELSGMGLYVVKEKPTNVYYNYKLVGEYYADLVVNEKVIIELEAAESLAEEHEFQLINYLKAMNIEVGAAA